jgi:signal transduction histidine kinase
MCWEGQDGQLDNSGHRSTQAISDFLKDLGILLKKNLSPDLKPLRHPHRLAALGSYGILDTPREAAFDDITRMASMICGTPMAAITLIDADRQWFKSEVGLGMSQTPISESICAHVVLENDVLIIPDTSTDPRFGGNPLYTGSTDLKFYAGAPITTADGIGLGTMCVLDTVSRDLSSEQIDALKTLARQVMMQLELRKRLRASEQTSDYRARLLASAAHDLRQPLFVASLSVQSLMQEAAPHQLKRLTLADGGLETIKKGFNGMLVAASRKASFSVAEVGDTDLGDMLDFIRANFSSLADRGDVRLRVMPTRLRVQSDAVQLETLVGNLVANAVRYTRPGGRVLVGCRRHAEYIALHVIDTGVGMASDSVDALFDAFRQGDVRSDGLGLGLWIVKRTAEALGVSVQVHSVPERGTHFSLHIPLQASSQPSNDPAVRVA